MISVAFIALGRSCLFAKTRSTASRSSSSFSIRCNSSRASEIRSRSLLSTTKMIPCVFWKSAKSHRHPKWLATLRKDDESPRNPNGRGGTGWSSGLDGHTSASSSRAVKNGAQGVWKLTMAPQGPNLVLAPHVPDRERDVLVLDSLDVESCRQERAGRTPQ